MRTYYYNEPYRRATWRRSLPTLCIIFLACLSYAAKGTVPNQASSPTSPASTQLPLTASQPTVAPLAKPEVSTLTWKSSIDKGDLLSLTNKERNQAGLSQLAANRLLDNSADAKCRDMVTNNYWSHIDLSGQEPWHFIDEAGYKKAAAGENLAYGFTNSAYVVQGWMNSPEHRAALLDPQYRDVGFGICTSLNFIDSGPQTIVVQHFGLQLP